MYDIPLYFERRGKLCEYRVPYFRVESQVLEASVFPSGIHISRAGWHTNFKESITGVAAGQHWRHRNGGYFRLDREFGALDLR
jgi:hypothetical protein